MTQTKKNEFSAIPDSSPLACIRDLISSTRDLVNHLNGAVWDMRKMGKTAEVNTLVLLLIKMFEEEGFEAFQIAQDLGIDKDLFTENGVLMPPLIED